MPRKACLRIWLTLSARHCRWTGESWGGVEKQKSQRGRRLCSQSLPLSKIGVFASSSILDLIYQVSVPRNIIPQRPCTSNTSYTRGLQSSTLARLHSTSYMYQHETHARNETTVFQQTITTVMLILQPPVSTYLISQASTAAMVKSLLWDFRQ